MMRILMQGIFLILMGTASLAGTEEPRKEKLEMSVNLSLSDSELTDGSQCQKKVSQFREAFIRFRTEMAEIGMQTSMSDEVLTGLSICDKVKESHQQRQEIEAQVVESAAQESKKKISPRAYLSSKEGAEKIWSFEIKIGGSLYSGNTDLSLFEAGVKAKGEYQAHTLSITTTAQYRKTEEDKQYKMGVQINDSIQLHEMFDVSENWGAFWDVYVNRDDVKGVDRGLDIIAGGGYNFWGNYNSDEKLKLSVALGHRSRENSDGTEDNNKIVSTRVSLTKKVYENISIKSKLSHVASMDDFSEDFEAQAEGGVVYKMTESGSLEVKVTKDYDNTPVLGKEKSDTSFKVEYTHKF